MDSVDKWHWREFLHKKTYLIFFYSNQFLIKVLFNTFLWNNYHLNPLIFLVTNNKWLLLFFPILIFRSMIHMFHQEPPTLCCHCEAFWWRHLWSLCRTHCWTIEKEEIFSIMHFKILLHDMHWLLVYSGYPLRYHYTFLMANTFVNKAHVSKQQIFIFNFWKLLS